MFLFGEQLTYSLSELKNSGYDGGLAGYTFIGNGQLGYKVAFCVRDTFIYGSMALAGLVVSLLKKPIKFNWIIIIIASLPMILDGGIQFVSEFIFLTQVRWGFDLAKPPYLSNNVMRAVTGTFFGVGIGLVLFSELKDALSNGLEYENNK